VHCAPSSSARGSASSNATLTLTRRREAPSRWYMRIRTGLHPVATDVATPAASAAAAAATMRCVANDRAVSRLSTLHPVAGKMVRVCRLQVREAAEDAIGVERASSRSAPSSSSFPVLSPPSLVSTSKHDGTCPHLTKSQGTQRSGMGRSCPPSHENAAE
jgi:ribosomal protein S14